MRTGYFDIEKVRHWWIFDFVTMSGYAEVYHRYIIRHYLYVLGHNIW